MTSRRTGRASLALLPVAALSHAPSALACSVCFGDPNSSLGQGVQAGVLVLLGVIGTVLLGVASLLVFWMRRAARLRREDSAPSLDLESGSVRI